MSDAKSIQSELAKLIAEHGPWSYDIPLGHGIWTRGNEGLPHTRLRRLLQATCDILQTPPETWRVLDLGCLDGQFSIEFALQGAEVIGVDAREANIVKAEYCRKVLNLNRLRFLHADVRDLSAQSLGEFDVILCSGLLYHLPANDAAELLSTMYQMTRHLVLIDTHISLLGDATVQIDESVCHGHIAREHAEGSTDEQKRSRTWASADNNESFWFSRSSLINLLANNGFSSVYECFNPPHLNFGRPGLESNDRCTFVAIKGVSQELLTAPITNETLETFPERSLQYPMIGPGLLALREWVKKIKSIVKRQ